MMIFEHFSNSIYKTHSKWVKDLNVRTETIKVIDEKIGTTFFDISCSNDFQIVLLWQRNQNKQTKKQRDLFKIKKICTAKVIIHKKKKQPTEWEKKIFANGMTSKELISKIYK